MSEHDYDKTERRIIDGKKIQYSAGGSRKWKSIKNQDKVSSVGVITDAEKHSASSPYIPVMNHPGYLEKMLADGTKKLPAGTKFTSEFDEEGRFVDSMGRKWSRDSYVMPGDVIDILDHEDATVIGCRAMVRNVRNQTMHTVSAVIKTGPQEGAKYVFEKHQYKVSRRMIFEPIGENDYLAKDMNRKDIVRQDLED